MMDDLLQLIVKSYGLVGVILLSPFIGMYFLWKDNKSLRKDVKEANAKIEATQEKRIQDAKEISEKLIEMSSEHAALTKETNIALDRVGDTLTVMTSRGYYRPREVPEEAEPPLLKGTKRG